MAKAGLLFAATKRGLAMYSEPGGMGRWLPIGVALPHEALTAVWTSSTNPLCVLAGGTCLWRSDDGGQQWHVVMEEPVTALSGVGTIVLACTASGVLQSDDAGASWRTLPWLANTPMPTLGQAVRTERLAVIVSNSLCLISFTECQTVLHLVDNVDAAVTIGERILIVCGQQVVQWEHDRWQGKGALPSAPTSLTALAGTPLTLVAGQLGSIEVSHDLGQSWQRASHDIAWEGEITALSVAPYHYDIVAAGTSTGRMMISSDRGATWRTLRGEHAPITSLAMGRII